MGGARASTKGNNYLSTRLVVRPITGEIALATLEAVTVAEIGPRPEEVVGIISRSITVATRGG